MISFAELPGHLRERVDAGDRLLLVFLDAFGRTFLERHAGHPLVRRLHVTPLLTQFPSTTAAHVTTLHFGLPVEDHGLYEWHVLEPSLGEVICPLRFTLAAGAPLEGRLSPEALRPGPTLYETLGAPALVLQPTAIAGSTFSGLIGAGARLVGFAGLGDALRIAAAFLRDGDDPRLAVLYWDAIDAAGHRYGPSSPEFAAAARAALDAVHAGVQELAPGVRVLLTADHGQLDVSPDRHDHLDALWPELAEHLAHERPAGSSRDVFLHVRDGHRDDVVAGLRGVLGDRAEVRLARELFPWCGPRLEARLGDVVVLPAEGRQAWLRSAAGNETWFRGQHGGRSEVETATYLAEVER